MLRKNRLFTPGPTPILPAAQTAMASFAMHHRTADFRALFQRVLADMKDFIGTQNDVLVLASLVPALWKEQFRILHRRVTEFWCSLPASSASAGEIWRTHLAVMSN